MHGVVAEPDHVIVCCAASQALTVLGRALRHQGARRVAVEDPGWRPQRRTVERAGLEAIPVRVDAGGLVVSELAAADVDAVVLTPAHHYPTGVVMTAERRGALIAWARPRRALLLLLAQALNSRAHETHHSAGRDPGNPGTASTPERTCRPTRKHACSQHAQAGMTGRHRRARKIAARQIDPIRAPQLTSAGAGPGRA